MVSFNVTPRKGGGLVAPSLALLVVLSSLSPVAAQKLNEIIVLGSHNSYHYRENDLPIIAEWNYDHPLVAEQAGTHGVRHFEFDIQEFDGTDFPVIHVPGYDQNSSCSSLTECVTQLHDWSTANRNHTTFFVFLELVVVPNTTAQWDALDATLTRVWGDDLLTPTELRGEFGSLREALIVNEAWPNVEDVRGQAIFLVNSATYLAEVADPSAFQLFDFAPADAFEANDNAVFLLIENANGNDQVVSRSREGYMIRARADDSGDFVFPVPVAEDAERIIMEYFAVLDEDNDAVVTTAEIVNFFEAQTGLPVAGTEIELGLNTVVDSCSINGTGNFVLANVTCIQTVSGGLRPSFRLPPLPSDFLSVEQATSRRDGNLESGAHMIATDHFILEDASSTGGYAVTLAADCEYYLNPASSACRSPPEGFPEACRPLDCLALPVVENAARLVGLNAATIVFVLGFSYIAFV